MNRLIDLIPFIAGALLLLFLGALAIDLFVRRRRRPCALAAACSHGFLSVNEARSLKPAPSDSIPVPIRFRPWPVRLVNSFRVFRAFGLSRRDAAAAAWSMALIGTPADRARAWIRDAWSGVSSFFACFGIMAPLFAVAIAGSMLVGFICCLLDPVVRTLRRDGPMLAHLAACGALAGFSGCALADRHYLFAATLYACACAAWRASLACVRDQVSA
jgi:hypothetical protein